MNDDPRPRLWVFAGPNGAGKSTFYDEVLKGHIEQVNADDIARSIDPSFGVKSVSIAARRAVELRDAKLAAGESLSIETTLAGKTALRYMQRARERGYILSLVYIGLSAPELSRARIDQRVANGGHDIAQADVERRYPQSLANLAEAMRIADRSLVYDNSDEQMEFVVHYEGGRLVKLGAALPDWARTSIPQPMRTQGHARTRKTPKKGIDPFE